jgi:hypothetical protein
MAPGDDDFYDDRPRRRWLQSLTSGIVTLAVIGLVAVLVSVWAYESAGPKARAGGATTVILRKGGGVSEVANELAAAGVVRSSALFIAAAEITRAAPKLKAGEYAFPSEASLAQVIRKIRTGDIVHHRITIAEGLTSQQAVDLINACDVLVGQIPTPPEGSILPETYEDDGRPRPGGERPLGPPQTRLALSDGGAGGDLGLHHREGDGLAGGAAAGRRRLCQSASSGDEAAGRSDGDLRHHWGPAARARHPRVRASGA